MILMAFKDIVVGIFSFLTDAIISTAKSNEEKADKMLKREDLTDYGRKKVIEKKDEYRGMQRKAKAVKDDLKNFKG